MDRLIEKLPSILLVDDETIFSITMRAQAHSLGIPLTICRTVAEMEERLRDEKFDIVAIDYYLGNALGTEAATLVNRAIPVAIVSATGRWICDSEDWPSNIEKFVNKNVGPAHLLEELVEIARNDRRRLKSNEPASGMDKPYF